MAPRTSTLSLWANVADRPESVPESVDDDLWAEALQVASDVLFEMSGRRWPGVAQDTLRPVCDCGAVDYAGHRLNHVPDTYYDLGGCGRWELELPWAPVVEVVSVVIDGDTVPAEQYRVDDARRLVRERDDEGNHRYWPCWQDLSRPLGQVNTWAVTYTHGSAPPPGGRRAALVLAEQLARAWMPSVGGCLLPRRVQTISKQGVTLAMIDPMTLFAEGRTGIASIDLWLGSLEHGTRRRRAAVIDIAGRPWRRGPRFRQSAE